jgi:hypothetical protein
LKPTIKRLVDLHRLDLQTMTLKGLSVIFDALFSIDCCAIIKLPKLLVALRFCGREGSTAEFYGRENLHKAAGVLLTKETITGEQLSAIVAPARTIHGADEAIGSAVAASIK